MPKGDQTSETSIVQKESSHFTNPTCNASSFIDFTSQHCSSQNYRITSRRPILAQDWASILFQTPLGRAMNLSAYQFLGTVPLGDAQNLALMFFRKKICFFGLQRLILSCGDCSDPFWNPIRHPLCDANVIKL